MAKTSKQEAEYRRRTSTRSCGNCYYMNSDGSCQKVKGLVTPNMLCNLWKKENK